MASLFGSAVTNNNRPAQGSAFGAGIQSNQSAFGGRAPQQRQGGFGSSLGPQQ